MKVLKKMLFILLILIVLSLIIVLVAFSILSSKSNKILDDYSKIYTNQKYILLYLVNLYYNESKVKCPLSGGIA